MFFLPLLPTTVNELHALKSEDLEDLFVRFRLDGNTFTYSVRQIAQGWEWPFIYPLNTQHPHPASGMGSYVPICYQSRLQIIYEHNSKLPPNLFSETVNCTLNNLFCPHHIYSGISRHKYPIGTKVDVFGGTIDNQDKGIMDQVVSFLSISHDKGPSALLCQLKCIEICANCHRTLFVSQTAGVISSMRIRVFITASSSLLENWNHILLTMHWDYGSTPQVDKLPLGSFFGMTGSSSGHKGATMGHANTHCSYTDSYLDLPAEITTGYFYFPMPYWQKALIFVDGSEFIKEPQQICYQIENSPNYYDQSTTGHFHTNRHYYDGRTDGWRRLLSVENFWGHIVSVIIETDNLRARQDVPLSARWAALQADPVLFIDGSKSATMLGTGLEDYFSYSHGFSLAENTSYSFVGVPYTSPSRKEPLTWHSYRLHILDPIPFHSSCEFVMEGTNVKNFTFPENTLSYKDYWQRLQKQETVLSHQVMYYGKFSENSLVISDSIVMSDDQSEKVHHFKMSACASKGCGYIFTSLDKDYLGNVLYKQVHDVQGREFNQGDVFEFFVTVKVPNEGIILRRKFETERLQWNEMARVVVNNDDHGLWFIPMGVLSTIHTLRQEDLMISRNITRTNVNLKITIKPLTLWRDLSYTVLAIM